MLDILIKPIEYAALAARFQVACGTLAMLQYRLMNIPNQISLEQDPDNAESEYCEG